MSSPEQQELDFFDYANNEYEGEPSGNSILEFFEQARQIPMQAIGQIGNIAKALREMTIQSQGLQDLPSSPEFEAPRYVIPELPLPTSEQIGQKIGYKEPTSVGGRVGKSVFSNIGSAAPAIAATAIGQPEAILPLIASSAAGGAAGQAARELHAPEALSTGIDIGTQLLTGKGMLKEPSIKSSGIPELKIEKLSKTTKVTPQQYSKIKSAIEEKSKEIIEKNFSKSPTYQQIKETPAVFLEKLDDDFSRVQNLSQVMKVSTKGDRLSQSFKNEIAKRPSPPITTGEERTAYLKKINNIESQIDKKKTYPLSDLIGQFRSNNKELAGAFEATKSSASNEGKKAALLDWNRAIAKEIGQRVPNSQLNQLFISTNKRYSDAMNVDKIDQFIDSLFGGEKIKFSEAKDYFKDKSVRSAIRQTFGQDTEKQFSKVMKDVLDTEKGMGKLKVSESARLRIRSPKTWLEETKKILSGRTGLHKHVSKPGVMEKMLPSVASSQAKGESKRERTIDEVLAGTR
jgi:hypothetical protein